MERKERLKLKSWIRKDCCKHYNGTNIYQLGYMHTRLFKIAVCKDCGKMQPLSIFSKLLSGSFWEIVVLDEILVY